MKMMRRRFWCHRRDPRSLPPRRSGEPIERFTQKNEDEMRQHGVVKLFGLAVSLPTVMVITGLMLAATDQATEFSGQVLSASGALVVGGEATNPGHPVVGATVRS